MQHTGSTDTIAHKHGKKNQLGKAEHGQKQKNTSKIHAYGASKTRQRKRSYPAGPAKNVWH
eukprot:12266176-Prorocentrum_lima.AAC.1